jgi:hypothetical protein
MIGDYSFWQEGKECKLSKPASGDKLDWEMLCVEGRWRDEAWGEFATGISYG